MNLQNFCQRGGLALLALGVTGYAGLATLRPAPALAPTTAMAPATSVAPMRATSVPRAEAAAAPASPVIMVAAVAPVAAPAPEVRAAVSPPIATPVSMAVNVPVTPQAAVPPAPVQAALVTTCPIPSATPRPFRHVWEPRSHRWSRANTLHAGARGERGRSITHAARAEASPYGARGWSDRRVD